MERSAGQALMQHEPTANMAYLKNVTPRSRWAAHGLTMCMRQCVSRYKIAVQNPSMFVLHKPPRELILFITSQN